MNKINSVAVFCGSKSGANPLFIEHAKQLGKLLAQQNIKLIYGGGSIGIMGGLANAMLDNKGKVVGIIPKLLVEWEQQHNNLTELIVTDDMHSRKKLLYEMSDAAIILAGGYGTLDELFELITWNNLKIHEKKVYILTGPEQNGVVIFGNDYLMTFDKDNNLIGKKQLHKNIISINYGGKEEEGKEIEGTIHTHLPETGEFITATDICTLMLYEKFAKWKQHNVVSKNYLNIWNCLTDQLVVIPMGTIDKINKDQEKRNKKKQKDE